MKNMGGFASVNDDILENILSRLPALSFASAACVSKSWNKVCDRILSSPKLASALSTKPSLPDAVTEVLEKVLSGPIRPQFAIASIGSQFKLEAAHKLIAGKLGSRTPIITNAAACGIIGREAVTNTVREIKWDMIPEGDASNSQEPEDFNRGIVLTLGYLPGLKVEAIPLLRRKREHQGTMIPKFVMDISNYTASVSGSSAPAVIILFGDKTVDVAPALAEIDNVMPKETVIVGDASSHFVFRSGHNSQDYDADLYLCYAVALVVAKDKDKPHGFGETRFHPIISRGVIPFGPELKTVSVTTNGSKYSWLTASMNEFDHILDSQRLLHDIGDDIEDESPDFYIGVVQKRPSSIEPDKSNLRTYINFYKILGGVGEYLVVDGAGIKPGDKFLFYHTDLETAAASSYNALENLKDLKSALSSKNPYSIRYGGGDNGGVLGGFIFSSRCTGGSYLDSFPFYKNFPSAPLAGVVCNKEIGRDSTGSSASCSLHVCTSVYLVLSYLPPSSNFVINS